MYPMVSHLNFHGLSESLEELKRQRDVIEEKVRKGLEDAKVETEKSKEIAKKIAEETLEIKGETAAMKKRWSTALTVIVVGTFAVALAAVTLARRGRK
jgi:hypothetical protein